MSKNTYRDGRAGFRKDLKRWEASASPILSVAKPLADLEVYREALQSAQDVSKSSAAFAKDADQLARREARASNAVRSKENALALTNYEAASSELELAEAKNIAWSTKRKRGLRKFPTLLQSFMSRFADFLEAYSGIVEIVKQADSQYGGLAYSTLSLLLLVAVNKSKQEEKIQSTLDSLRRRLPRVNKLQELIPGDESAVLIGDLYSNVIEFARACVLYYTKNSLKRVLTTLKKPPKLYIDKEVEEIDNSIVEVEKEAAATSYQRIKKLEARQNESRIIQIKQDLLQLRRDLGLVEQTAEQLAKYRRALLDPSTAPKKYKQFSFEDLRTREAFQSWVNFESSSLFLIHGLTLNPRTGYSWLSPAALEVFDWINDKVCKAPDQVVICGLAHTSAWTAPSAKPAAHIMISRLIMEILERDPSYLLDPTRLVEMRDRIKSPKYKASNPHLPCRLLSDVMGQCSSCDFYVVLDRIDACDCTAVAFIERLVEIVLDCRSTVKFFVVAGGLGNFDVGDITTVNEGEKFRVIRMDQSIKKTSS